MSKSFHRQQKKQNNQGLLQNPLFYFGLAALFLWGMPFFSFQGLSKLDNLKQSEAVVLNLFFKTTNNLQDDDLFFGQNNQLTRESPDLKIIQGNSIAGVSTPRTLTTQTLGNLFGESVHDNKEIIDRIVEPGDTIASIAKEFGISKTTLALANNLSTNASLKVGQNLTILPVDGLLHIVKSGNTIGALRDTYKARSEDIISFNNLVNEEIFIGDVLLIPYGIMPPKPVPSIYVSLPDSFFIYPTEGRITQGLHYYNAVDVGNKCGTPIYAAASGIVQRARYDSRYGNYITILHSNGIVTYYGHLQAMFVKSGDPVTVASMIASMGRTGRRSTGCHLHLGVSGGAKNPLPTALGADIKYK